MKRGEIWIASLEPKTGSEVGKKRPVLVLQTDLLNQVKHPTVVIAPISSQEQSENLLRYKIENKTFQKGFGYILIDQIRAIDVSLRLKKKIGAISTSDLKQIEILLRHVLDLY